MPDPQWTTNEDGIRVQDPVQLGISGVGADEKPITAGPSASPGWVTNSDGIRVQSNEPQPVATSKPSTTSKHSLKGEPTIHIPTSDEVIQFLRPIVAPAAGAAFGTAASPFITPAGGIGAGMAMSTAVDGTMQNMLSKPPTSTLESVTNSGKMLLGNEIGSRILGRLFGTLAEVWKPGSTVPKDSLDALEPTYSQLKQKLFGKAGASKWIEDVLANGQKASAIENSAALGMNEGTSLAAKMSKTTPGGVSNPEWMGARARTALENNLSASYLHSDAQAMTAKAIAKTNPALLSTGETVDGPITINSTLQVAQKYLDEKQKLFGNLTGAPDPEKPLIAAAQNIIAKGQPVVNPQTGQIVKSNPISFEDAWNFKKAADKYGYGDPKEAISHTESLFKDISRSLNDDIDGSIGQWPNDPTGKAKQAWLNAKATVAQRFANFGQDGVRQLINTVNSPVPEIDKIINDPVKLQRALTAGELKLPGGTVQSTNLRKDLQGYQLMKLLSDARTIDPLDASKGTINASQLVNRLNDPEMKESYGRLFSQQNRADIDQLFNNLAVTQQRQATAGSHLPRLALYHAGVAIPTSLLTGATTYGEASALAGTAVLTGMGLARVMTNPKLARPLIALAAGQPAGVSDQYLSRALVGALQGAGNVFKLIDQQGREKAARIENGQLIPER